MKILSISIVMIMLIISAIKDIKNKRISIILIGITFTTGLILLVLDNNRDIFNAVGGITIGLILIAISIITREQIGIGDGLLICTTGIYLGLINNVMLLLNSIILAAIYSIWLITIKKADKKKQIPFVPFILIAYMGMVIL